MPPIDQDLLRQWLQRIATAKDDPNEWETGQVELTLASGGAIEGCVVGFVDDVLSIDVDGTTAEVKIEEIVDLSLSLRSPGPE